MRHRGLWLSRVGMVVLLAAVAQITMHTVLYGEPSLFGKTPSFLTARLLGDGPARSYLQDHCAELHWALCSHVGSLPVTEGEFLWKPDGIWQTATPQQKQQLRQEEMPLVKATLNAYPLQQARQSGINFLRMLGNVGPAAEFDANPVLSNRNVDPMIWRVNTGYLDSRQAHNQMPDGFFRHLDEAIVLASLGLLLFLLPRAWHRGLSPRLTGLSAIVLLVLPANAFLTGVFSGNYPRYQGRVVWLLLLLAALLTLNESDKGAAEQQNPNS
jgi:hypothetical protein